jgi:hypothetical protein
LNELLREQPRSSIYRTDEQSASIEPMTERFDIAVHPTQGSPKPGIDARGGRIARGDAKVMPMQRFTLGAVRRDGSSAT